MESTTYQKIETEKATFTITEYRGDGIEVSAILHSPWTKSGKPEYMSQTRYNEDGSIRSTSGIGAVNRPVE